MRYGHEYFPMSDIFSIDKRFEHCWNIVLSIEMKVLRVIGWFDEQCKFKLILGKKSLKFENQRVLESHSVFR